ncbi:aspartate carbamoyltransferase catalytic subunit [Pullulanibacillus pueri]|uniref:Aspartate carbamoyltransferase n=1 Tax=Pullulanibacillus pueri TaxID=1437324 RepID=A0A8J2ZSD8_9BACL|nr:aspartate carbamoyltransferase catalytic subunit [Pullulanibacillus pueri]MBM7680159.1 aspartate carbamoyltransferase catalytic subunit [Pullulanibacillus pueri]GGH74637.1 aspartate carbamoyltransferase [Pullulanibacillus pueri]
MPHLLSLTDLSVHTIEELLTRAQAFQDRGAEQRVREPIFVANLFFEPSTRTRFSFEVAEKRLGLNALNFDDTTSSTQKGETLYDTLRVLEELGAKAAVIRHSEQGFYEPLQDRLHLSLINAGDGSGHHPSQTLLDLLTIQQEFSGFKGLTVAMIGDLRHSRVARSNAEILTKLGASVILSGPPEWHAPEFPGTYVSIEEAIETADVVNLLRIQTERHDGEGLFTKETYHQAYGLTLEREKRMKAHAIIMHPAPFNRGVEIASELVECRRSRIFKQMHNGVHIRMAILEWALGLNIIPQHFQLSI